jgi:hypothetical protein
LNGTQLLVYADDINLLGEIITHKICIVDFVKEVNIELNAEKTKQMFVLLQECKRKILQREILNPSKLVKFECLGMIVKGKVIPVPDYLIRHEDIPFVIRKRSKLLS